ncbi:hypothetical protein FRACA_250044 [Frankia canadensis]|uniref:Fido domain-containing protein n=1 Tax=Frankia canadensis TaxID=1836972 RepID=A0A2I2KS44_9ACTN|nr:Fic family protein [Frankia canadensis]SNQ48469.1 hypothetical protein FRACA_250044 [Frankia canadensis]SOU55759.1 hypothetical protein FRACA_250044 [Frankia canadensis]
MGHRPGCAFCADDTLPAVAQAALAHAQFETIHPFVDGNGRTGRALIHMVLRRRGLATRVLPPVSLILATWSRAYLAALDDTHQVGPATSGKAQAATDGLGRAVRRRLHPRLRGCRRLRTTPRLTA